MADVPAPGCPRCFIENKPCALHCDPVTCPDPAHRLAERIARALATHGGSWTWGGPATEPVTCGCGQWRGCITDHRQHVAAEIAAVVNPPETRCCTSHHFEGCTDGGPGCCARCPINPTDDEGASA